MQMIDHLFCPFQYVTSFSTDKFNYVPVSSSIDSIKPEQRELLSLIPERVFFIQIKGSLRPDLADIEIQGVILQALKKKHFRIVVIDFSVDPARLDLIISKLEPVAKKMSMAIICLGAHYKHIHTDNCVAVSWPWWFYRSRENTESPKKIDFINARSRKFSSLNRVTRSHRVLFYSLLKKNNLIDKFILSYSESDPATGFDNLTVLNNTGNSKWIPDQAWQQTLTDIKDFPITWQSPAQASTSNSIDLAIDHPAYWDAYCNIPTETDFLTECVTEKVWKPIASGQLFLTVSAANTCKWLNDLGFYTFDDAYDAEHDPYQRILKVIDAIQNKSQFTHEWFLENQEKITHNQQWFFSNTLKNQIFDQGISEILKCIKRVTGK